MRMSNDSLGTRNVGFQRGTLVGFTQPLPIETQLNMVFHDSAINDFAISFPSKALTKRFGNSYKIIDGKIM